MPRVSTLASTLAIGAQHKHEQDYYFFQVPSMQTVDPK